ncbi:MAG: HD domain-containing protein [Clostridia bacterium]|nr:HD domain-containing protein [Clostridia bacterium]
MVRCPKNAVKGSPEAVVYADFSIRADRFVSQMLAGYKAADYRDIKVIHDPVWGTMKFYPWELQILDSPLMQRLRNVNQLGLAVLTYPSAHHSRFEHTLGVTALVTKMVDSINDGFQPDGQGDRRTVPQNDHWELRLAAILHDVGHSFFSHLSERMYGNTEEFENLKGSFEIFSSAQPHEILAYVIVNTPSFKEFFASCVDYPEKVEVDTFFDDIGRMIVGAAIDTVFEENGTKIKKHYLTEMINGQFDADSLDYLRRDSYITGLSLTYHIDRFLYKIKIVEIPEQVNGETVVAKHLTVPISGVSTVEEMIFGKQMLTRYIYQHQKVLAADALVYDVVSGLRLNGKLQHPCDFLYYCDDDIYKIYDESGDPDLRVPAFSMPIHSDSSKTISDVVRQIKSRTLPKKALVINMGNLLDGLTLNEGFESVKNAMFSGHFRQAVRDEAWKICERNGLDKQKVDLFDIFYSAPKPSTAKNYTDVRVATHDGRLVELSEVADLNDWADEFSGRAWNAYVFTSAELLPVVSLAAKNVLEKRGVCFNNDRIFQNLKHSHLIEELK